ncbi:MAG TPA: purine phosphorylase [Alphaproteobacteria bacterium]|nr:purine phosphorylase [Alphaproteobacteria bacterium]
MRPLGIVTGLRAEARILSAEAHDWDRLVRCKGPGPERANDAAQDLIKEGVCALVSAGVAAGLDPRLESGTVVVADAVLSPDGERFETDPHLRNVLFETLRRAGVEPVVAALTGVDRPVLRRGEKIWLFRRTGAGAVDMESHAVARAAQGAGLPFGAVRLIVDPARQNLPRFVAAAYTLEGRLRPLRAAIGLCLRPWEIVGLVALARRMGRASSGLRRVAPLLGLDLIEDLFHL